MDYQTIATNLMHDHGFRLKMCETSSFGPAESLRWVCDLLIEGTLGVYRFKSQQSQKQAAVKAAFKKVADYLTTLPKPKEDDGPKIETPQNVEQPQSLLDKIEKLEKLVSGQSQEIKGMLERIKSLEDMLSKVLNDSFALVEATNNNSIMHTLNGNTPLVDFLSSILTRQRTVLIFLSDCDAIAVPYEVFDTWQHLESMNNFESAEEEQKAWLEKLQLHIEDSEYPRSPEFARTIQLGRSLGLTSSEIAAFIASYDAVVEIMNFIDQLIPKDMSNTAAVDFLSEKIATHVKVLAVEADKHNSNMHALNGNTEVVKILPQRKPRPPRKQNQQKKEKVVVEVKTKPKPQVKKQNGGFSKKKQMPVAKQKNIMRNLGRFKGSKVANLVEAIMLPYLPEAKPKFQWPRPMSDIPTFPDSIEERVSAPWDSEVPDASVPYQWLARTYSFACAFRSFLLSYILYACNGNKLNWSYLFWGYNGSTATRTINYSQFGEWFPLKFNYGVTTSTTSFSTATGWAPHGPVWYAGKTEKRPDYKYFWFQKGHTNDGTGGSYLSLTAANIDAVNDMIISINAVCYTPYQGETVLNIADAFTIAASSAHTFNLPADSLPDKYRFGCYVALEAICSWGGPATDAGVDFSMQIDGAQSGKDPTSIFCHRAHASLQTLQLCMNTACVGGLSLWYENAAADAYKNGFIFDQEIPKGKGWTYSAANIDTFVKEMLTQEVKAKQGSYQYLKPNTNNSFDLVSEISSDGVSVIDCAYNIDSAEDFLCTLVYVQEANLGVSQMGLYHIQSSFEFVSTNPLFRPTQCPYSITEGNTAQDIIRRKPRVFENKSHLSRIGNFLKKVVNGTKKGIQYAEPFIDLMI